MVLDLSFAIALVAILIAWFFFWRSTSTQGPDEKTVANLKSYLTYTLPESLPDKIDLSCFSSSSSNIVLLSQAQSDAEETQKRADILARLTIPIPPHRIIFSSTKEGRASIVRQLQPVNHYETDGQLADLLVDKVPKVTRI
jgi:hypothetical protein